MKDMIHPACSCLPPGSFPTRHPLRPPDQLRKSSSSNLITSQSSSPCLQGSDFCSFILPSGMLVGRNKDFQKSKAKITDQNTVRQNKY